jgi:hypothetical protein
MEDGTLMTPQTGQPQTVVSKVEVGAQMVGWVIVLTQSVLGMSVPPIG